MSADFAGYTAALEAAGQTGPAVLVDLDAFERNLASARAQLQPGMAVRLVAKSLPCLELLRRAAGALGTDRMMTFSDTMLTRLLGEAPAFTHLLGKPFPVAMAAQILAAHPEAASSVTWLIDSPERLAAYDALARGRGLRLKVALEINIGLNRGGFDADALEGVAERVRGAAGLEPVGVMAYEAHLAKLPGLLAGRESRRIARRLASAAALARALTAEPLVNVGGSLTFARYGAASGANEVAFGSVLVKPGDFETAPTAAFEPAAFIATPVLKYLPHNPVPGFGRLRGRLPGLAPAQIAVWGGYWPARPVFPAGYRGSRAFGHSSNQEVWSGPSLDPVPPFAFLRPDQSEAVLNLFGRLALYRAGEPLRFVAGL